MVHQQTARALDEADQARAAFLDLMADAGYMALPFDEAWERADRFVSDPYVWVPVATDPDLERDARAAWDSGVLDGDSDGRARGVRGRGAGMTAAEPEHRHDWVRVGRWFACRVPGCWRATHPMLCWDLEEGTLDCICGLEELEQAGARAGTL